MPETFMNLSPARPRTLSVKLTRHWRAWGSELGHRDFAAHS